MSSIYKSYSPAERDELNNNFLVDSWSYSKLSTFSRNEKAFEMSYIYRGSFKESATTAAGSAYHFALCFYFYALKEGRPVEFTQCEEAAFSYIEEILPNKWKLQKTTPTVDDCKAKSMVTSYALLRNFFGEISTYTDTLLEILCVEYKFNEYLTINGVDIPIPCNGVIDLAFRSADGKVIIVDHKSKASFTGEDEIVLSIGVQAITYIKGFEESTGVHVDEVWFVENKYSKNKDGSPQLQAFKIILTEDTRRLYEALLYEPLRKMIAAVNDPDYVYLINNADNYVDRAEVYEFWCKTMIAEVDDFNVLPNKKDLVAKRLKKIRDASIGGISPQVIKNFQTNAASFISYDLSNSNMTQEQKIEHVLRSFGILVRVAHSFQGYSSNTYLVEISAGTKINSIYSHRLDIANVLDVSNVRVSSELVVHEGKSYLSIDLSKKRDKDLVFDASYLSEQKIPIGKDNFDNTIYWDLSNHSTPHMLVCGATGSGKSVSLMSTISYAELAGVDEIVILDPKFEFTEWASDTISVYNDIASIEEKMMQLVEKMNELVKGGRKQTTLVVFDEFADALAQSRKGGELDIKEMVQVGTYAPKKGMFGMMPGEPKMQLKKTGEYASLEENLKQLLQKGRSCGFRIIAATQRASVKVITGDAKVNFPVQICFRVPKEADSRVVIDEAGAEALAGRGDGLIKSPEYNGQVIRFQAFYKPTTPSVLLASNIDNLVIVSKG